MVINRVCIYARVSTSNGRQDAENQLSQLREWAVRLGGSLTAEYVDTASGSRADRKALNDLLEAAHRREVDTVLIWALDRLSREGIARMAGYLDTLKRCGVRIMSHQEPWLDTAGPVSELITAIFAWVGQFERQRITERIQAGLERAKRQGKQLGRPRAGVNKAKARKLKRQGHSIRKIAQIMGVPRSTLSDLLSEKGSEKAA